MTLKTSGKLSAVSLFLSLEAVLLEAECMSDNFQRAKLDLWHI